MGKQKYTEALHNYVTQYFGRPLEKVNQFFDGVSAKISAGVKEAEISYQLQYSKQELRKVLSSYPGKEVKKGLADLYKKVEKHLSEEESPAGCLACDAGGVYPPIQIHRGFAPA